MMNFFSVLERCGAFIEIARSLQNNKTPVACFGLSHIHKAHYAAGLFHKLGCGGVILTPDESSARRFAEDLRAFLQDAAICAYPVKEILMLDALASSGEYEHLRIKALESLRQKNTVVVAPVQAAMQFTIPPDTLKEKSLLLTGSFAEGRDGLVNRLLDAGYTRCDQVDGVCTFAVRGGLVDFFPPTYDDPVRVEFWGDVIDSVCTFSIETQRRIKPVDELMISPSREAIASREELVPLLARCREKAGEDSSIRATLDRMILENQEGLMPDSLERLLPVLYKKPSTLLDYIKQETLLIASDPVAMRENLQGAMRQVQEDMALLTEQGKLFPGCDRYSGDAQDLTSALQKSRTVILDTFSRDVPGVRLQETYNVQALALPPWNGELPHLLDDIRALRKKESSVTVSLPSKIGCDVLHADLAEEGISAVYDANPTGSSDTVTLTDRSFSGGFEYPACKSALISHVRTSFKSVKPSKKRSADALRTLEDLSEGDYIVHVSHGIGVFEGIIKREAFSVTKDYIKIRYRGTDVLFVPVTQLDLVSKYIGKAQADGVKLSKLGSPEWSKTRFRVRRAVADMADELSILYKKRLAAKGHAFSPDNDWQRDFELRFPFEETDDQLRSIVEIKEDMEGTRPMDRLLCGDVGFGKTEVAVRAAFKCVTDSKQCAVLVPTTILAWQHFRTFSERMEGFPIRVEMLSRFRSARQQSETIRALKSGEADIVIGTHRLLQKDVEFRDLGLCVIDEEQRFGVAHKERFKQMRESVDVLTLSATPIPRTLSMAMSGIRDMSLIEEAPQDRHPVQTYVVEHDWGMIAEALRRELRRGGQAFYLHNRIESIDRCALNLRDLLPDARIEVAHGQMGEDRLSSLWQKLVDYEIDILVCTTIIETGVDIPNCNTLVIEDADRMGLAQLYQLRGRVGRSPRRAFAYLTFRPSKVLSEQAAKRLEAIKEFTSFGSGFRIALRDMEIRGAGSVLGASQHGHMEAVGYEMYLQLLSEAVAEQRGEPIRKKNECKIDIKVDAHIPEDYIEALSQRLDIYKKIAAAENEAQASDVIDELIDRFGDPPPAVAGLIQIAMVRNRAAALGIREITQRNDQIFFYVEELNPVVAAAVAGALRKRVLVNAGQKPYITVLQTPDENPVATIAKVLDIAEKAVEKENRTVMTGGEPLKNE